MTEFIRQGKMKWRFLPTVAGYATGAGPTSAEVAAGTDLSRKVTGNNGWMLEGSEVDIPNYAKPFTAKIPGTDSVGASDLTFLADDTSDAIRAAQAKGTKGYMYIEKGTGKFDLFPIQIMTVGDEYALGNEPARYRIQYSITDQPLTELAAPS